VRLATLLVALAVAIPTVPGTAAASGAFAPVQWYPVGSHPEAVAIGDVTGDGRNDVVMTTSFAFDPSNDYRLWVFAQRADGHLAAPVSYATAATYSGRPTSVAIGDLTGDGLADVVAGLAGVGIQLFPQLDSGELGAPTLRSASDSRQIRLGNLDGDDDLDVAGLGWGSDTVTAFFNDGTGGLALSSVYPAHHDGYDDLEVADVNGDGLDDLVVMSGQGFGPNLSVLAQLASGGFEQAAEYSIGDRILSRGIAVGDVNGDGFTDVVASHGGNRPASSIAVFQGNASGALEAPINFSSYDIPEPVEMADVDLDGDTDVVTLHGGWNQAGVYRQQPGGSLGYEELYAIPYASHYEPHGLAVGDISGDGSPDVVIADYNHGLVVLRNNLPSPPSPTLPGAPELTSASRGNARVSLFWKAPGSDGYAPISGFNVYRGTSSDALTLLATVGGTTHNYTDTSVVVGTTYFYRIAAVNVAGEGARSVEKSATAASVPGAPTLVSASPGDTSVALGWTPPASDGASPIIEYTATASPGGATCRSAGTSCTVTGLTNGTTYSFTVKAVNQLGYGPASNALSAVPRIPGDPPSAPQSLATAPNQPEGILLSWSTPASIGTSPITGYRIYRGTVSGGATYLATVGNVLSFVDTGVVNGGRYYYQVSAVNTTGEGPRSGEVSAQRGTAPSAPRNLSASAKPTGITLKWSAPAANGGSAVTSYRVYRGNVSGGEVYLTTVGAGTTSYTDKSTTKGTRYFYWVTAVNVLGVGPASNEVNLLGR
jgi:fibronectin type 3 domain-containing protein